MARITDLIETLGYDDTARLLDTFGGMRLYVPRTRNPSLSPLIDPRTHARLITRYGGEQIDLPLPSSLARIASREARNDRIRKLSANGMSIRAIARLVHVSRRQVLRVLRASP